MKQSWRARIVCLLLTTLSLNLVAAPDLYPLSRTQAETLGRQVSQSPARMRDFVSALLPHLNTEGWKIETEPGRKLMLSDMGQGVRDLFVTPPASSGLDLALKIRATVLNGGLAARFAISAYDRGFREVLSRRLLSLESGIHTPDQLRIRFEQTVQSLANEVAGIVRSAARPSTSAWQEILFLFFPMAHAADTSDGNSTAVVGLMTAVAGILAIAAIAFFTTEAAATRAMTAAAGRATGAVFIGAILAVLGGLLLMHIGFTADADTHRTN